MLLANARIGRHEQIRLQPFIAGSIDAPIRLALLDPADEASPQPARAGCGRSAAAPCGSPSATRRRRPSATGRSCARASS